MRCPPFLIASYLYVFLLDTQKEPKRCPLLAIAREALMETTHNKRASPHGGGARRYAIKIYLAV